MRPKHEGGVQYSKMAALPDLITVAQYRQLPENDGVVYELHQGEVVVLSHPKPWRWRFQRRLVELLESRLPRFIGGMEFAFRAIPEFDLRAADVAALYRDRYEAMNPEVDLFGAPELVIEVKSPPNTKRQLQDYAALCLANGSLQFWVWTGIPNPLRSFSATAAAKLSALARRSRSPLLAVSR